MSERFLWLDVAKGIAIILMVLGHTVIPECASNISYAFIFYCIWFYNQLE